MKNNKNSVIINVDADGTCFTHDYPNIGKSIGAETVLKELTDAGHKLIIFTMRSGKELNDVVKWYHENNIPLYGINTNPTQKGWTSSPKSYAHFMIDDSAIGTPLLTNHAISARPYVDWVKMRELLVAGNLIG